jgi:tetratricopeptide (TPR) repeat protein
MALSYDVFLSHASSDKPWVRILCDALKAAGLEPYLDEQRLEAPGNYVDSLNGALGHSRFLVLIASPQASLSGWVRQEWTSFLAHHGPRDRIIVVVLEPVEIPPLLAPVQQIVATKRDPVAVAAEIVRVVGRLDLLPEGDSRALIFGQDLVFVISRFVDGRLEVIDPAGNKREVPPPWREGPAFTVANLGFRSLSRQTIASDADRAELHAHAKSLGRMLFHILFGDAESRRLLEAAQVAGRQRPLLTLRSDDDVLLSLPWELLHDGERFLVRDYRIDLARSTQSAVGPGALLDEPAGYFKLVVNVSAPAGSGLSYEEESYRITRALSEHCELAPTELGTVDDLIATVERERPIGVHFSGHGSPGQLVFENDEGEEDSVSIGHLLGRLRERVEDGGLPKFFYLASCYGNEPGSPDKSQAGSESSAAAVQRAGIPQVVGYYGPIVDQLSTRAEEALYAAIAAGHTTRYAVRQARAALAEPFVAANDVHRPGDGVARDGAAGVPTIVGTNPFAWAQLVLYHYGPEHPLGKPVPADALRKVEQTLERSFRGTGDRKILSIGFIGRRAELHRVRKRLLRGDRVLVFQGLGGLGKTTLAFHTLPMLASENDVCTLWCREAENETNPAETLVGQLLDHCRRRFGLEWEGVVQQVDRIAGDDSAKRFGYFLHALLENVDRLVVYLDNLESLLVAPREPRVKGGGDAAVDTESFATWRNDGLRAIWKRLDAAARESGKLHVVATCRYRNDDFAGCMLPVSPLPPDALYRLLGWFPALRRLSSSARAMLVARLDGHPRAVEYANDLIGHALAQHEDRRGTWQMSANPQQEDIEREWKVLVEPALPLVQEQLRDNLLLAEIWEQLLDDRARRMLYRMTLLRLPWEWDLMTALSEPDEEATNAEATAKRLARTSLLEQVEVMWPVSLEKRQLMRLYTLHPTTAEFIRLRHKDDDSLLLAAHRRIGELLEAQARPSPYINTAIEAGHHLFAAGEFDRSCDLLSPAAEWLLNRGRVREGLRVLEPLLPESVRKAMKPDRAGKLLSTVGRGCARLGQLEKAIASYEQALLIAREIGDRRGEGGALDDLGKACARLGQVEKAITFHERALLIAREIGHRQGEGTTLGNLGAAYVDLGQVEKAISFYEQALLIAREVGDRRGEGNALGNLGSAYGRLGQVEKAITLCEQRLVIAREVGDRRGEGSALGNLGTAYVDLGQVEKAITFYEQALVIDREMGDRPGEGAALGNLGRAYARLGQVEKARGCLQEAVRIGQEIKDPEIVRIFSQLLERLGG